MNEFTIIVINIALLFSKTGGNVLPDNSNADSTRECYIGVKLESMGMKMSIQKCQSDMVCSMANVNATYMGLDAIMSVGQCTDRRVCSAMTCDEISKPLEGMPVKIKSCKIECCLDKECSNQISHDESTLLGETLTKGVALTPTSFLPIAEEESKTNGPIFTFHEFTTPLLVTQSTTVPSLGSKVCDTGLAMPSLAIKMTPMTCLDPNQVCLRARVTASVGGVEVDMETGACSDKDVCEDTTCSSIQRQVALQSPGATVKDCTVMCDAVKLTTTTLAPGITTTPVTTRCLQGMEVKSLGMKMKMGPCDSNSQICVMYDMTGVSGGIAVDYKMGQCINKDLCDPKACVKAKKQLQQSSTISIDKCTVKCYNPSETINNLATEQSKISSKSTAQTKLSSKSENKVCQSGISMPSLGIKMKSETCPDTQQTCQLFKVTGAMSGASVAMEIGTCSSDAICKSMTCDDVAKEVEKQSAGAKIEKCSIYCDGVKQSTGKGHRTTSTFFSVIIVSFSLVFYSNLI